MAMFNLVDKFFNQSELAQKSLATFGDEIVFPPSITVARDPGSGGKPIAQLVAKKLGYEFYDEKLIEEVAKSAKLRKEILKGIDEKQRGRIQDLVHQLLNPDYVAESTYIKHLCRVLLSLAQKGGVVFLGRGSNFVVPSMYTLRVRVTAPYRVCVQRAVEHEEVDYQEARDIIRKVTAERVGFVKQYFGKNLQSSKYYDLTLNTTYMSLDDASDLILLAYRKKFPKKGLLG